MREFARNLLLALQFFTRLPLPASLAAWADFSPARMRAALVHFPAIGWLTGSVAVLVYLLVLWLWGSPVMLMASSSLLMALAALLSTLATIWLTGALHEDGLSDVADALGGHASPTRALEIMKDSRVGSYAVITLVMTLLLKVLLLASLGVLQPGVVLASLLCAHVVSRFFPLLLINALPHIGLDQQSKTLRITGGLQQASVWSAALWCLPLAAFYYVTGQGAWTLAILGSATIASGIAAALMGWWFRRRLQGFTGDCLGATQQVCELVFYAASLTATLYAMAHA